MSKRFQILVVFFLILAMAASGRAAVPAWLEGASRAAVPEYGSDISAVCLLEENRTAVGDNGDIREFHRVAYKILSRDGLGLAWLRLSFDNETRINDLKAWNLKSGGVVHEASQKDGIETQLMGGSGTLFQDTKSLLLVVPQVEVGSIVAYEYERRHRPNVLQDFWVLQNRYPVLRSRIELQLPEKWEFQSRILRRETVQPREIAKNDWVWELMDLAPIRKEEGMPSPANVSALLVLNYFPSADARGLRAVVLRNWDDFASWTSGLVDSRFAPTSEMTQSAQKLGSPQALGRFVQENIRYVAIEIGIGGYQPHLAEETFRNRYGDCKDKVTLFRSLMKALNREVYPVLINADRGGLVREFPSPLYFNHMIAAVPIADNEMTGSAVIHHPELGSLLLFDPTDERTPFGRLPTALQGTQAVLVRGTRGFVIDTPVSNTADNRVLRVGTFKIATGGKLSGQMSESFWGALSVAESNGLLEESRDEWARGASRALSRELPGNEVRTFAVSGLNQPDPLQERYLIDAPNFVQTAGNLLLFRPSVFGSPGRLPTQEENRAHPFQFHYVQSQRSTFSFEVPEGYTVEATPPTEELDLPFAHYRTETTVEANTLRFTSIFDIKKLEVAPSDFGQLRQFYDLVDRASRAVVVLKTTK